MSRLAIRSLRRELVRLASQVVRTRSATAVVGLIGDAERTLATACCGRRSRGDRRTPSPHSLFDLASLSKPFTATLAVALDSTRELPLTTSLAEVWDGIDGGLARVTLDDLLRHRSGLIPWTPLYSRLTDQDEMVPLLLSGKLLGAPPGTYSDLGYILWSRTVEQALGEPVGDSLRRRVLRPLGLQRQVTASAADRRRHVECTLDNRREIELASAQGFSLPPDSPRQGQVQDGNARWLGGYSGHAGLFGSAKALWRLGAEWLRPGLFPVSAVTVALAGGSDYGLGWRRRSPAGSGGPNLGPRSFGHNGFTGGSVWIDPDVELVFVFMAHRPSTTVDLDPWRRQLHALPARQNA